MEDLGAPHIGVLTADFFIPHAGSLKEKRSVLRSLRDRVRAEFNVSAAEVEYQDKWQRSRWVFTMAGPDKDALQGALQKLLEFLRAGRHATLTDHTIEFL